MLLRHRTERGFLLERSVAAGTQNSRLPVVPASARRLYGYEAESWLLRAAVERGKRATIGIRGAGGVGKTEFLAQAVRTEANGWRGKLFVPARHLAAEDVIALVVDAVFAIREPRSRPSASVCGATLANSRLLVALDDVRSLEDLACVRAALAASCICFTSDREFANGADEWIELRGVAIEPGMALLRDLARPRPGKETAATIVANLRGNPSRIRRAAFQGVPLRSIAANCTSPEAFDEFQLSLVQTKLSRGEIARLTAVAAFGDAALIGEKTAALVRSPFIEQSCAGWSVGAGLRAKLERLDVDDVKTAEILLDALRRAGERLVQPSSLVEGAAGLLARKGRGGAPARAAAEILVRKLERRGMWAMSATLREAAGTAGAIATPVASAQTAARRRTNGDVGRHELADPNVVELLGAGSSSNGGLAGSLNASGMLALAGVVALALCLLWTAFAPRPHAKAGVASLARMFPAAASSLHRRARNTPRLLARSPAPHHLRPLPRVEPVAPPRILLLSMLPRTVFAGATATLCLSAAGAQSLFVTGLGAFNPGLTTCRTVSPKKTTAFVAYAADARGRLAQRQITVVVEPTVLAANAFVPHAAPRLRHGARAARAGRE